jgi:hypothetical protein
MAKPIHPTCNKPFQPALVENGEQMETIRMIRTNVATVKDIDGAVGSGPRQRPSRRYPSR